MSRSSGAENGGIIMIYQPEAPLELFRQGGRCIRIERVIITYIASVSLY
ncbi:MAG: hypothetical protein AB8F95_16565 [Bacteroidia bacterium]